MGVGKREERVSSTIASLVWSQSVPAAGTLRCDPMGQSLALQAMLNAFLAGRSGVPSPDGTSQRRGMS